MALGLSTGSEGGSGNFKPILKYDARAGRFFRVDRSDESGSWQTDNVDITQGFQAVFDLDNIEVGYIKFAAGGPPDFRMVPLGSALPARPADQGTDGKPAYKQGFRLSVKLTKAAGGDVRELSSTAGVVVGALDGLHTAYEAGKGANPGKLPVVALTGSTPIKSSGKGQSSTNYAPIFEIVKWVDRPADLTAPAPVAAQPAAATVTPITAARPTPAAAPAPVAQMRATSQVVEDDEVEF